MRKSNLLASSGRLAGVRRVEEAAAHSRAYVPGDCRASAGHSEGGTSRDLSLILARGAVTDGGLESLTLEGFRWHWLDLRDVRMWHVDSFLNGA